MWDMAGDFVDPLPWTFYVEEGLSSVGDWTTISPEAGIVNQMIWPEIGKRLINKDLVLFFRIRLETGGGTYYSHVKTPYGDLDRREYLLVREMMRKEVLQAEKLAGILGRLWMRATFGTVCVVCRDPVTGSPRNPRCPHCLGTGRDPGFHGPYCVWMTFSPAKRDMHMPADGTGTRQPYDFQVRMIGFPYAKDGDVIVDPNIDKRYYVDQVRIDTEIRRIPVIQTAMVREVPVSDPVHMLGQTE